MHFNGELKKIADVDIACLVEGVSSLDEERWYENVDRQKKFEVHTHTQTIALLQDDDFRHKNPTVHKAYSEFKDGVKPCLKKIKTYFDSQLKYKRLQKKHGNGYFIRILLTRLDAGGEIPIHRDIGYSLSRCHRIHMPVITNDDVMFCVGSSAASLGAGELWEINNRARHAVRNESATSRVHLIMDYVIPGETVTDDGEELVC